MTTCILGSELKCGDVVHVWWNSRHPIGVVAFRPYVSIFDDDLWPKGTARIATFADGIEMTIPPNMTLEVEETTT